MPHRELIVSLPPAFNHGAQAELSGGNDPKDADIMEAQFSIAATALDLMREEKISGLDSGED